MTNEICKQEQDCESSNECIARLTAEMNLKARLLVQLIIKNTLNYSDSIKLYYEYSNLLNILVLRIDAFSNKEIENLKERRSKWQKRRMSSSRVKLHQLN